MESVLLFFNLHYPAKFTSHTNFTGKKWQSKRDRWTADIVLIIAVVIFVSITFFASCIFVICCCHLCPRVIPLDNICWRNLTRFSVKSKSAAKKADITRCPFALIIHKVRTDRCLLRYLCTIKKEVNTVTPHYSESKRNKNTFIWIQKIHLYIEIEGDLLVPCHRLSRIQLYVKKRTKQTWLYDIS